MSPLRQRMIEDMKLAGLSAATHTIYINAVGLAAHDRRSPDELSEEEVRAYLLKMREQGAARGTFKAYQYGIQFLYRSTLNRDSVGFKKDPPAQAEENLPNALKRRPSSRPSPSAEQT